MADPCGTPVRTAWQTNVTSRYLQGTDRPRSYATSHLTVLWLRVELLTACSSLVWLTALKAFEKSMVIITVRTPQQTQSYLVRKSIPPVPILFLSPILSPTHRFFLEASLQAV